MFKKTNICFLINLFVFTVIIYFIINYFIADVLLCDNITNVTSVTNESSFINESNVLSEDNCYPINETILKNSPGLYIKYKLIFKRKLYWYFQIGNSKDYSCYNEFKPNWDPNKNLWKDLVTQFETAIKDPLKDFNESRNVVEKNIQRKKDLMEIYAQARAKYHKTMATRRLNIMKDYLLKRNR